MTKNKFKTLIGMLTIDSDKFDINEESLDKLIEYYNTLHLSDLQGIVLPDGVTLEVFPNPGISEKISEMAYKTLEKLFIHILNDIRFDNPPYIEDSKDLWNWINRNYRYYVEKENDTK
jgi:hypothetical protein